MSICGKRIMTARRSITLICIVALSVSFPLGASSLGRQNVEQEWAITEKHDREVRQRNEETDFFLVSTVKDGLEQVRFYIDRNTVTERDTAGIARAWVDWYEVASARKQVKLTHGKMLVEVQCGARKQMRFLSAVTYGPDGAARSEKGRLEWNDVIPASSMNTQYRFICSPQPANALYPVFGGSTPKADATAYYAKQAD
jgi:hypothetical protein